MVPPFIWIRGKLWVIANWDCKMSEDAWLLLRPATTEENYNCLDRVGNAEEEAFFTSILLDQDRLVGRTG